MFDQRDLSVGYMSRKSAAIRLWYNTRRFVFVRWGIPEGNRKNRKGRQTYSSSANSGGMRSVKSGIFSALSVFSNC
jgi:hypothetical protein